jgi:tetratricopeptide (TPR) repeat protein
MHEPVSPTGTGRYGVSEAAELLQLSPARVRAWVRAGWIAPERGSDGTPRFCFRDLVFLRRLRDLHEGKISPRRVRRALTRLRASPKTAALAQGLGASEGQLVVREGDALWNPESGQALFDFAPAPTPRVVPLDARSRDADAPSPEAWVALGDRLADDERTQARRAYRRALDADPEHVDAHINLGCLDHEDGALASAENHYRAAAALRPSDPTPHFDLAIVLEDQGRAAEAADAYRAALAADPAFAEAHFNLARLCEQAADRPGALRHWKAYRQLLPAR